MTDTSTRPAAAATRWDHHSPLQTSAELLLGLSFAATVAFGGYAAVTGRMTLLSQVAGIVFLVTLTCVLVSWFRAVERSEAPVASRRAATGAGSGTAATPATPATAATPVTAVTPVTPRRAPSAADPIAAIAAIDAEYRR